MLKKIYISLLIITFSHLVFAETCPDIASIKAGQFKGWQALDLNSDFSASDEAIEYFKNHVKSFYQAEWAEDFIGPARCYYTGDLEVGLAKDVSKPKLSTHWIDIGILFRCKSGVVKDCEF